MAGNLNAKVIMARCSKTQKTFGMRTEQRGNDWIRTWAFPIDESKAKREGFDANTISGSLNVDDEYPGCPHCGYIGFVQCQCGKIGCNGGVIQRNDNAEYTCPWCKQSDTVVYVNNFNVSGEGY